MQSKIKNEEYIQSMKKASESFTVSLRNSKRKNHIQNQRRKAQLLSQQITTAPVCSETQIPVAMLIEKLKTDPIYTQQEVKSTILQGLFQNMVQSIDIKQFQAEMKMFSQLKDQIDREAQVDTGYLSFIMQLLTNIDNHILRFMGATALRKLFQSGKIHTHEFKQNLVENRNNLCFLTTIVTFMFTEKCVPIKTELAHVILDVTKQYSEEVLLLIVQKALYIDGSVMTLQELYPYIDQIGEYISPLYQKLIWSLGILSSEKPEYAELFLQRNGVEATLRVVESYKQKHKKNFEHELESITTYALTCPIYERECNYLEIKNLMPFLQTMMLEKNYSTDDCMIDALMGMESILQQCQQATQDFGKFRQLDELIDKLLKYYSSALMTMVQSPEDDIHMIYPILRSVAQIITLMIEGDEDGTIPKTLCQKGFLQITFDNLQVMMKANQNIYWGELFKQIIEQLACLIEQGPDYTIPILKDTQIIQLLFQAIVFQPQNHAHPIDRNIVSEFMSLMQHLAYIEDEFCFEKIVELQIIYCCLYLISETRFGKSVTMIGLDIIDNIFQQVVMDVQKIHFLQQQVEEYDARGENGIEILQQMYFDENQDISEKANQILTDHFGFEADVLFGDFTTDEQTQQQQNDLKFNI